MLRGDGDRQNSGVVMAGGLALWFGWNRIDPVVSVLIAAVIVAVAVMYFAAGAISGFKVVDPVGWICSNGTCPAVVGNVLAYRDQTHLTTAFSAWLAPLASTVLQGA